MAFEQDKKTGDVGEDVSLAMFRNADIYCEKNDDMSTRYEFDLDCDTFKCEVKTDMMSIKTGNLAIEVENCGYGTPSGLAATKSEVWVEVLPTSSASIDPNSPDTYEIWIADTEELKSYMRANKPDKKFTGAGDGNALIWLYKKLVILTAVFTRVDNATPEELNGKIYKILKG
tara:strand:+ start:172 stop:690 length:519 start_codon:yes stop_codon:yes gene_type:complete